MNLSKKGKMLAAILAIAFIAYNVTLFTICGFTEHTAVFWISWLFMLAAFAAMTVSGVILGKRGLFLRDWLFGFPIVRHSTVYLIAELLASILFILFEDAVRPGLAFGLQFLLLCIYGVCAVSCFLSKETIDDVHTRVSDKTRFIRLLCADAEMLVEKCPDPDTKEECRRLAEAIRYSDPMSSEALFELEKELSLTVSKCDSAIGEGDFAAARELCARAALQLTERNRKCKALK